MFKPEQESRPSFHEYVPDPSVIEVLRGKISDPITTKSYKPGPTEGKMVEVRLVTEGVGLFGLTDWRDNKEWSGINNHDLLTTRYYAHFSQAMYEKGHNTNPQRGVDAMPASHGGRRRWDEAGWYPESVENAAAIRSVSNETLGMQLVQGKIPQDAFELVVALGHNVEGFSVDPKIYKSLDFLIAIYVDHRTTQKWESLHTRMGDFLLGNFFERGKITPELKEEVYSKVKDIIDRQKDYKFGKRTEAVPLDEADEIAAKLGANEGSERLPRRELLRLILQDADTEALLIQEGIDVNNINDQTVPLPKWEHEYRMQYVQAAEPEIIARLDELFNEMREKHVEGEDISETRKTLASEFSVNTWWGQYARKLWTKRKREG